MPHRFDKWEDGPDSQSEYWADGPAVPKIAVPNLSIGRESPIYRELMDSRQTIAFKK
jgi:hypothetical protein